MCNPKDSEIHIGLTAVLGHADELSRLKLASQAEKKVAHNQTSYQKALKLQHILIPQSIGNVQCPSVTISLSF